MAGRPSYWHLLASLKGLAAEVCVALGASIRIKASGVGVWLLGLSQVLMVHSSARSRACSGCLSSCGDLGCHHTLVGLQGLAANMCMALEVSDRS